MNSSSEVYATEALKMLDDGVKALFDEMLLATQWQKPAYLMAVYRRPEEHIRAMDELADKLLRKGYSVCSIDTRETGFETFLRMIFADAEPDKKVYFVENLCFDGTQPKQNSWQTFYFQRDGIDTRLTKMIFWLSEEQMVNIALTVPSYWENRYQVVDLTAPADLQPQETWANPSELQLASVETESVRADSLSEALLKECKESLRLGILDWRRSELDSAYQYLRNSVDLADVLGEVSLQADCQKALALVLMDMKNPVEAIEAYNKLLELDPSTSLPWNNLGNLYHEVDDLQKAEESFLSALEHNPANVVSWTGLAGVYEKMNMLQEALDAYRQALRIVPDFILAWHRIGGVLEAVGQIDNAIKAYEVVIRQSAKYIPAWVRLAKIYQEQTKLAKSIDVLQQALEHSPSSFDLWLELGDVASRQNQRLAADAYRKALAINPRFGPAYCRLAQVHEAQGNLLDAISCYEIGINFLDTASERSQAWDALMSVTAKKEGRSLELFAEKERAADEQIEYQPATEIHGFSYATTQIPLDKYQGINIGKIVAEKMNTGSINVVSAALPGAEFVEIPSRREAQVDTLRSHRSELTDEINAPSWYVNKKRFAQELHHARQVRLPRSQYEQIQLLADAMLEQPRSDFWQPHKKNRHRFGKSELFERREKAVAEGGSQEVAMQSWGFSDKGSRAWMRQGKHLLKRGFYDDALAAFANAVHDEPDLGIAYINMGIAYFLSSRYDQALVQFYKGLELTENTDEKALAWNYIGDTYRRLHDSDNAMKAYQKISESKKSENVLRQRARRVLVFGNC